MNPRRAIPITVDRRRSDRKNPPISTNGSKIIRSQTGAGTRDRTEDRRFTNSLGDLGQFSPQVDHVGLPDFDAKFRLARTGHFWPRFPSPGYHSGLPPIRKLQSANASAPHQNFSCEPHEPDRTGEAPPPVDEIIFTRPPWRPEGAFILTSQLGIYLSRYPSRVNHPEQFAR